MSALPKSLAKLNIDVKVIIPRYKCIPQKFQEKIGQIVKRCVRNYIFNTSGKDGIQGFL